MNRRTALRLTLLTGGLLPTTVLAQQAKRAARSVSGDDELEEEPPRDANGYRRPKADGPRTARRDADDEEAIPGPDELPGATTPAPAAEEGAGAPPPDFRPEPGQAWRTFDLSKYTSLRHNVGDPQKALVEWIFRDTGSTVWHSDKIAVLCASRTQLRVYNTPKILKRVAAMVERFTNQQAGDYLKLRVRFVAAVDTRWRYAVATRLKAVGSGPQGQQIWTLKAEDAEFVRTQMSVYQGFRPLADQELKMVNGQTLTVRTTEAVDYIVGPQRDSAIGLGFQPGSAQLEEGIVLRISPLLTFEGDALDAAIDLKVNTVKSLHRTRILTRREVGPSDMTIDVPEVVESRLNQTVQGLPLGETLLISGGIHPGILQSKGGFMNLRLPGTVPTSTEALVFVDIDTGASAATAAKPARSRG